MHMGNYPLCVCVKVCLPVWARVCVNPQCMCRDGSHVQHIQRSECVCNLTLTLISSSESFFFLFFFKVMLCCDFATGMLCFHTKVWVAKQVK